MISKYLRNIGTLELTSSSGRLSIDESDIAIQSRRHVSMRGRHVLVLPYSSYYTMEHVRSDKIWEQVPSLVRLFELVCR